MTTGQWIAAVLIHLGTPLAGIGVYVWLCTRMSRDNAPGSLRLGFFILFLHYGGYLLVVLTLLFWRVSGMFLAGSVYLVTVAPVVSWIQAALMAKHRVLSKYHRLAFRLSLIYPMAALALVGCLFWGTALLSGR
jgi:hypothetical protein